MRRVFFYVALISVLCIGSNAVQAERVATKLIGVEGELRANVEAHLSVIQAENLDNLSIWRVRQLASEAREEVRSALEPFGFYSPRILVRLAPPSEDEPRWITTIDIEPGEPVRYASIDIRLLGSGERHPEFLAWRAVDLIQVGDVVSHRHWDQMVQHVEQLCQRLGYFDCHFSNRRIEVNPTTGEANAILHLDTGERYHFNDVIPNHAFFNTQLMRRLSVIEPGQPYTESAMTEQRQVLATSGLFQRIMVEEQRDEDSHEVNVEYTMLTRPRDSYRATVGVGTDTGTRFQLGWQRHYLSPRGNRLDSGFGVQEKNDEYILRSEYFHPRGDQPTEFWTAAALFRREQDSFRFNDENQLEPIFESYSGPREQAEFRAGRLNQRVLRLANTDTAAANIEERIFMAVLNESFNSLRPGSFSAENTALLAANPDLADLLQTETRTLALGISWRLPEVSGRGFFTEGLVLNAHLMGASASLGSDVSFLQAYLGGRWHYLLSDRHKLLLAAELGHTEANTTTLNLMLDDKMLDLGLTELPERYRFKTGGDRTVRGYAFETLSTNRNGGNHLLRFSMEYEYRVGENWSIAAFYDTGNAFNDWGARKLKRGVGVGFRWYTLIGPVQVDIAQALDDVDRPWRLHFTLGTRLL